jgi:hypothetical protein
MQVQDNTQMQDDSQVQEDKPQRKYGEGFRGGAHNINKAGRKPQDPKKLTKRELRERELLMLLRKIKPHVAESIVQAARIMKNTDANPTNQLRAATLLLDNYRRLTLDLYEGDEDAEGTEIQQNNSPAVLFSLKMVDKPEDIV